MHADRGWRPHVQGLRALAVLLVVLAHARVPGLGAGFVGVDIFFVISGFVITASVLRRERFDLLDFWVRRVRRLLPALALLLVVVLAGSALLESPIEGQRTTARVARGAALWHANLVLADLPGDYFARATTEIPLLHTWSLSVEEQFYLGYSVLLLALLRHRRALTAAVAVGTIASLAWCVRTTYLGSPTHAFYGSPSRAWEFGAGALLAMALASGRMPRASVRLAAPLGLGLLALSLVVIDPASRFPGVLALGPVGAAVLLVAAGEGTDRAPVMHLIEHPLAVRLGDLSYSWYLWHWPPIVLATTLWPYSRLAPVVAAVVGLGLAALGYRLVERPWRVRVVRPRAAFAVLAVCALVPSVLATGLLRGADQLWGDKQVAAMARQVSPKPLGYGRGCHVKEPLGMGRARCTFGDSGEEVYLVGDSNAAMWADGLVAGLGRDHRVTVATWSSCPLIDITFDTARTDPQVCRRYVTGTTQWLLAHPGPSTVVLGMSGAELTTQATSILDPATGQWVDDPGAKARLWRAGLTRTLRALRGAGHEVVVVETIPQFPQGPDQQWWDPRGCAAWRMLRDVARCGRETSLASADHAQATLLGAQRAAVNAAGARLLPVRGRLCPHGQCSTEHGGRWVYRDGVHISVAESRDLSQWLREVLTSPVRRTGADGPG